MSNAHLTLISSRHATPQQKTIAKEYLTLVLERANCTACRIVTNRRMPLAILSHAPHTAEQNNVLDEKLSAMTAMQLLKIAKEQTYYVTMQGVRMGYTIHVTDINPTLLKETLHQEKSDKTGLSEADMHAWIALPELIQRHWSAFNTTLRVHIMECMMRHLQEDDNYCVAHNQPTFFARLTQAPAIPVELPHNHTNYDLLAALTTLPYSHFKELMPDPLGVLRRHHTQPIHSSFR